MTQRERQILHWIEENPLISQDELAEKAGISRSSVSVHISNLMKKGYIAGRGYVLRSGAYVAVIGGVNIDICGQSYRPLIPRDSNPGFSRTGLGGVGRNIAHNLSLLGVDVLLFTAFGDDGFARQIGASCSALGIDISHAKKVPGASTSTYIFLNDPAGDMALAVSDMAICDEITPQYLAANLSLINNAQAVVIDANIPEESIRYLAENCNAPIFADPVSVSKAGKLLPYLGKLFAVKPNRLEAELLSGVRITGDESLRQAAEAMLATGLCQVYLSLGSDGVYAASGDEAVRLPCCPAAVRNSTGAGDAFMAAIVRSQLNGNSLRETCRIASAAAAVATESEETINPNMSMLEIRKKIDL